MTLQLSYQFLIHSLPNVFRRNVRASHTFHVCNLYSFWRYVYYLLLYQFLCLVAIVY